MRDPKLLSAMMERRTLKRKKCIKKTPQVVSLVFRGK
jgi:hypothetical protein